jgi:hypothetical protein
MALKEDANPIGVKPMAWFLSIKTQETNVKWPLMKTCNMVWKYLVKVFVVGNSWIKAYMRKFWACKIVGFTI